MVQVNAPVSKKFFDTPKSTLAPFSLGCSSAAAPGGDNRYHQVDADNFLAPKYLVPEYSATWRPPASACCAFSTGAAGGLLSEVNKRHAYPFSSFHRRDKVSSSWMRISAQLSRVNLS